MYNLSNYIISRLRKNHFRYHLYFSENERLASMMYPILEHPFTYLGGPSGDVVIATFFLIIIIDIVLKLKEAKNIQPFHKSPNAQGVLFQALAILVLLLPKIAVAGKAINYNPHSYLLITILEFLIISLYNYVIFRSFEFFSSTFTAMIVPAFYQPPTNAKKAYTTKIWRVRSVLGSYGNTPHVAFIYLLVAVLVYTPTVIVLQSLEIFNIYATHFPLAWCTEKWSFWMMLIMYFGGLVLYLPFSIWYRRYGNNWCLLIKKMQSKKYGVRNRVLETILSQLTVRADTSQNKRIKSFELGTEPSVING